MNNTNSYLKDFSEGRPRRLLKPLSTDIHYPQENNNIVIENISIDEFFKTSRRCSECGQDHSFRPDFSKIRTSIDVVPFLIKRLREWELKCKVFAK